MTEEADDVQTLLDKADEAHEEGEYVKALNLKVEAMDHVETTSPGLPDSILDRSDAARAERAEQEGGDK